MTINDIKESGLLELFVMNALTKEERQVVLDALIQYPELKEEVNEIEITLQHFASSLAIQPRASLKDEIFNQLNKNTYSDSQDTDDSEKTQETQVSEETEEPQNTIGQNKENKTYPSWMLWTFAISCLGLIAGYFWCNNKFNSLQNKYDKSVLVCDSIQQDLKTQVAILESLNDENNQIIKIKPTEKYPVTKLYFHNNPTSKKNFLQVQNLPPIAENQSFQLWSLKGDDPPIPLNVFERTSVGVFEVDFVDQTNAYAITVEPKGGQDSPTLDNLIGVFSI